MSKRQRLTRRGEDTAPHQRADEHTSGDKVRHSKQTVAYVALGSNLGDSPGNVLRAIGRLQEFSDIPLRKSSPWKGRERTRALEFGKSPLPMSRADNFELGKLFGTPTLAHVSARGTRTACYLLFLARLPSGTRSIHEVAVGTRALDLIGAGGRLASSLPATAIHQYLG